MRQQKYVVLVQWGTIMLWTIIPNVIIFGSLIAILQNFPRMESAFCKYDRIYNCSIQRIKGLT